MMEHILRKGGNRAILLNREKNAKQAFFNSPSIIYSPFTWFSSKLALKQQQYLKWDVITVENFTFKFKIHLKNVTEETQTLRKVASPPREPFPAEETQTLRKVASPPREPFPSIYSFAAPKGRSIIKCVQSAYTVTRPLAQSLTGVQR